MFNLKSKNLKKRNRKMLFLTMVFLGIILFQVSAIFDTVEAYGGTNGFSNGELQRTLYDTLYDKEHLVDWYISNSSIRVKIDSGGYPDGKGDKSLYYYPALESSTNYYGGMNPTSWTEENKYGGPKYGPHRLVYVGNQPFVIAFREKRSSNSASLSNIWRARIYAYKKDDDGTYSVDSNASYYLNSDRKEGVGFEHRFNFLDGSTNPNVSGGYDEWITNYITVKPDPKYPVEYVAIDQFSRFFSTTETWEGWMDNFWIGPADQFNPNNSGNEYELANYGSYYNDTKVSDPVDIVTGNYIYESTDISIPGRGIPLEFTRNYNSVSLIDGPLGKGWNHSYDSYLWKNPDQSVVVHYPDGKRVRFDKTETGYKALSGSLETLVQRADGSYTLTFKNHTKFIYDIDGNLTSITDKNGNQLLLSYNTENQLSTVTDSSGRTLSFAYNLSGKLISVTDPLSQTVNFEYDTQSRLTGVKDRRGNYTYFTYNRHGMTSIKDKNGNTFLTNVYDTLSRVKYQYDAEGNKSIFTYDSTDRINTLTDFGSNKTTYKYNEFLRVVEEIDTEGNTTKYTYDENSNLTSVVDTKRNTTTYSYDSQGNVLSKTDPAPFLYTTYFQYDILNNVTRLDDVKGNVTTFEYDQNGNLLTENQHLMNGQKLTTSYTYNSFGQISSIMNAKNQSSFFIYDDYGNQIRSEDALGFVTTATYDLLGRKTSEVSPRGNEPGSSPEQLTTFYQYDAEGNVTQITDPLGKITTFTYDGNGNLVSKTDARANITSYSYDKNNRLKSVTDAEGYITQYEYDPNGNMIKVIDPKGNIERTVYNPLNQKVAVIDPLLNAVKTDYDANGNIRSVTDAVYNEVYITQDLITDIYVEHKANDEYFYVDAYYNDTWNQVYAGYGEGAKWVALPEPAIEIKTRTTKRYSWSPTITGNVPEVKVQSTGKVIYTHHKLKLQLSQAGQTIESNPWTPPEVTSITSGLPAITYDYDELNRITKETDREGRTTTYFYDEVGNVLQKTDGNNHTIQYAYDELYQLLQVTNAKHHITQYKYDQLGKRTAVIDANGNQTTYQFDELSRMVAETDPLGYITSYKHDSEGNVISKTDASGKVTTYQYDNLNRLVSIDYPDSSTVSYSYDAVGNRTSMVDKTGTTTYNYDKLNRLTKVTYPGNVIVSYTYDSLGNKTSVTYPDGTTVNYDYDESNRLAQANDWHGRITEIQYNKAGYRNKEVLPNGIQVDSKYNSLSELIEITSQKGNTVLTGRRYTYDQIGSRTSVTNESSAITDYTYDELGRLIKVVYPEEISVAYTYDAVSNRLNQSNGNKLTSYEYDSADRLTVVREVYGDQTSVTSDVYYSYDNNGNMIQRGDVIFEYDFENRLIKVTSQDDTIEYNYDGDGNRVSKTVNSVTTRYIYDIVGGLPQLLVEMDGEGNIITKYMNGNTVVRNSGGVEQTEFHLYDALGSVIAITDLNGDIVATYEYDAFGAIRSQTGISENDLRFTGEQYDLETGLIYLRARYYDPSLGRFITKDSFAGYVHDPRSLNRYSYAYNNPVNLIDPSGFSPLEQTNSWFRTLSSGAVDFIPILGNLKSAQEAITGVDMILGQRLSRTERFIAVSGIIGGGYGKSILKGGNSFAKHIVKKGTGNDVPLGGAYKDVPSNGGQVHHMPANSVSLLSKGNGPGVRMETLDHRQTASWGNAREARAYRANQKSLIDQGKFNEAQNMDIIDLRNKFGNKYDEGIRQMIEYTTRLK